MPAQTVELVCPAGSLPALKAAADNGADCIYVGFRDDTNARNFNGLNFDEPDLRKGVAYAHKSGAQVLLALNTYPQDASWPRWTGALERAVACGVDAVIAADLGLIAHARHTFPDLHLHLSVQSSATNYEAINFYSEQFAIRRAVLPRVLSLTQVEQVIKNTNVGIEVFGFGGLCVMVEGRCALSAFTTGVSPNCNGACSPAGAVRWHRTDQGLEARLNGVLIDRYGDDEHAGYPTLCKGRFEVDGDTYYALEEPASLNTIEILPELLRIGVSAIKIEGRQRSPAYVAQVTRIWRQAIDACRCDGAKFMTQPSWMTGLGKLSEGHSHTLGAYYRPWK